MPTVDAEYSRVATIDISNIDSVIDVPREFDSLERKTFYRIFRFVLIFLLISSTINSALLIIYFFPSWPTISIARPLAQIQTLSLSFPWSLTPSTGCLSDDYRDGEWIYTDNNWYPYIVNEKFGGRCDRGNVDELRTLWNSVNSSVLSAITLEPTNFSPLLNSSQEFVRPSLRYVWTPNKCELPAFPRYSPLKFCSLLKGRNLLFVGDSTTHEHYSSLRWLLGEPSGIDDQFTGNSGSNCSSTSSLIQWARNDFLSFIGEQFWTRGESRIDVESPWTHLVRNNSIIVMNSGAHTVPIEQYIFRLTQAINYIRDNFTGVKLIWRTSVPGHSNCGNPALQSPLTQAQFSQINKVNYLTFAGKPEWQWELLPQLNIVARETFTELFGHAAGQFPIDDMVNNDWFELDAYSLNKLRPDSHRAPDCLHQCTPGPIDEWNRILFAILDKKAI